jgi:hypothetical protein
LSKLLNLKGLHVSVEENSINDVMHWLKKFEPEAHKSESGMGVRHRAFPWRDSILSDRHRLSKLIGLASAQIWLNAEFPEFNQAATCFLLALKYYRQRSDTFVYEEKELNALISNEFLDIVL